MPLSEWSSSDDVVMDSTLVTTKCEFPSSCLERLTMLAAAERCPPSAVLASTLLIFVARLIDAYDAHLIVDLERRADGAPSDTPDATMPVAVHLAADSTARDVIGHLQRQRWSFTQSRTWKADAHTVPADRERVGRADDTSIVLSVDGEAIAWRLQHGTGLPTSSSLHLAVEETRGALAYLTYSREAVSARRASEWLNQYMNLLCQIAAHPEQPIWRHSLMTDAARAIVPDPMVPLAARRRQSIREAFARAAREHSECVAIQANDSWTYGRLVNSRSAVAEWLTKHGVGRGDVVAIYAHRAPALVVAVLGALEIGASYLLLDPRYPSARLADYVNIARPAAWLHVEGAPEIQGALASALECAQVRNRCRVSGRLETEAVRPGPSRRHGRRDDAIYLSFTSGSTGVPKAVTGVESSVAHCVGWLHEAFQLTSADRFTMLSGLAHEPIQRDMFAPLSLGATLCIPSADEFVDPKLLLAWLQRSEVTVAHLTPGLVRALAKAASRASIPSLRRVFVVGDVLSGSDVDVLQAMAPNALSINLYGATETQMALAHHVVRRGACLTAPSKPTPLGTGIPGVQLLVLNRVSEQAGIGEAGEICVRSPYLARGYHRDPVLTKSKYFLNPWRMRQGDRVYRTGDLGRYDEDGRVEFLGRADRQAKIQGYRVELTEIEMCLSRHDAVAQGVVEPRRDQEEPSLVAFVVPSIGATAPVETELRHFLGARLPQYMVPSRIHVVVDWPLTPNAKIDRAALLRHAVQAERRDGGADVEAVLGEIWAEALGVDLVRADDDLFDLGGHSLSAMQIAAAVYGRWNVDLPISTVFDRRTIASLASAIRERIGQRREVPTNTAMSNG